VLGDPLARLLMCGSGGQGTVTASGTDWPRVYGNSSGRVFAVCSPALDSQQVVSMQLLMRAGRADGLSLTA